MIRNKHGMRHLVARMLGSLWAIDPEKLSAICELLTLRREGWELEPHEIASRIATPPRQSAAVGVGTAAQPSTPQVAVLSIQGTLVPRRVDAENVSSGGLVSTESVGAAIDAAAADPQVTTIVLDINSPGGTVAGTPELATRIAAAAQRKPVLAVANLQMASAAYWIASQASQVIASPSADIGSIGVMAIHQETSQADAQAGITTTVFRSVAAKADANGVEPLTEAARAAIETRIAETHQQFLAAVASGRRTTPEAVAQQFGQGRTLTAEQALAVGMIDRIATLDQVLAELITPQSTGSAAPQAVSRSFAGAAASPVLPLCLETVMDVRILTALIRLGAIAADATAEQAQAALQAACALRALDPNGSVEAIVAGLAPAALTQAAITAVAGADGRGTPSSAPLTPPTFSGVAPQQLVDLVRLAPVSAETRVALLAELMPQASQLTHDHVVARLNREAAAVSPPAGPRIAVTESEADNLRVAARDALLSRHFGGRLPSQIWSAEAQEFVDWRPRRGAGQLASLPRLAARMLIAGGFSALEVDSLSNASVCRLIMGANPAEFGLRADGGALFNTRGSFSTLLYDAANVVLRQSAAEAPSTYQLWMRRGEDLQDFKFVHKVVGGEMGNPQAIPENGEFQEVSFGDSRESYRLTVWGERWSCTWQTLVDDNLGALTTIPAKQGRAMVRNQNRVAYQTVKDNAALSDGVAFFHASHNNLAGTGTVLSVASLNAAEKAMLQQQGLTTGVFVGAAPRYLLVPPALKGTAMELLSSTSNPAASNSGVANIWQNGLTPIAEPELSAAATGGSDTAWYTFTDARDSEHFEYAFLAGMQAPVFEMEPSFERLGIAMRVYQPFATKGIEFRGGYKNPGA